MRHRCKGHCADICQRYEAKHCSSLCSQSEGGRILWRPNTAKNPTKSCPRALYIFATCSWPSLCEQSELQCWRRNRRLCGPVQISATRTLPLTFDITILNTLPFRGAVASLPTLWFLNFEHPAPPHITQKAPRSRCCYAELSIYHSGNPAKDCPREYLTKYLQAVRRCRRL